MKNNKNLLTGMLLLVLSSPAAFAQGYYQPTGTTGVTYEDAGGNVGIGTATPAFNLDVQGTFNNTRGIVKIESQTNIMGVGFDGASMNTVDGSGNAYFHNVGDFGGTTMSVSGAINTTTFDGTTLNLIPAGGNLGYNNNSTGINANIGMDATNVNVNYNDATNNTNSSVNLGPTYANVSQNDNTANQQANMHLGNGNAHLGFHDNTANTHASIGCSDNSVHVGWNNNASGVSSGLHLDNSGGNLGYNAPTANVNSSVNVSNSATGIGYNDNTNNTNSNIYLSTTNANVSYSDNTANVNANMHLSNFAAHLGYYDNTANTSSTVGLDNSGANVNWNNNASGTNTNLRVDDYSGSLGYNDPTNNRNSSVSVTSTNAGVYYNNNATGVNGSVSIDDTYNSFNRSDGYDQTSVNTSANGINLAYNNTDPGGNSESHFIVVDKNPAIGVHINASDNTNTAGLVINASTGSTFGGDVTINGDLTVNGVPYTTNPTWTTSDQRFKHNVETVKNPMEKILALNGVYYDYKTGDEYKDKHFMKSRQLGFLAQEVEKVVPEVVTTTGEGYKALAYQNLTALLVEGVKEQQKNFETNNTDLRALIDEKDAALEEMAAKLSKLEERLNALEGKGNASQSVTISGNEIEGRGSLLQNVPNPFDNSTVISYTIPAGSKGFVRINTQSGEVVKTIPLAEGTGTLELNFSDFPAGQLIYSLYIGDRLVDTKKMLKVK